MRAFHIHLYATSILLCCFAIVQAAAAAAVISTFDTDADGWTHRPGGDGGSTVSWNATGGNPGGRLVLTDASQGSTDYFMAPAKFLGNDIAAYGTQFTFDIKDNQAAPNVPNAVGIFGNGLVLTHTLGPLTANSWQPVSLTLDETGGWTILNGSAPTAAQFQSVLGAVTEIAVVGDFIDAPEVVSLDNVTLRTPEPGSLVLLLAGAASLAAMRSVMRRNNG